MSWNISSNVVAKITAEKVIDDLWPGDQIDGNWPAAYQLKLAKEAAKILCKGIPGPYVTITLCGHANGIGWQKKEGWSNDSVSVSVAQVIP